MKIVSLDQASSLTGVAVFDNGNLIKYDLIDLHKIKNQEERFERMITSISNYIQNESPDFVVFEDISLQTNVSTLVLLARIQGAIIQTCVDCNIQYKLYKPSSWRKVHKFNMGRNIKRPELKQQAKEYILKNYNLDLKIDQCEAICIGKAFLIENKEMIEEIK